MKIGEDFVIPRRLRQWTAYHMGKDAEKSEEFKENAQIKFNPSQCCSPGKTDVMYINNNGF
jgi:hypothetical protein